jgi:hypothetical protein
MGVLPGAFMREGGGRLAALFTVADYARASRAEVDFLAASSFPNEKNVSKNGRIATQQANTKQRLNL